VNDFVIEVDGQQFRGWTEASASRSMEDASSTFEMKCSYDPRSTGKIQEDKKFLDAKKPCKILIDGQLFLTGVIDKRVANMTKDSYDITLSGRSKTRDVVDSSASTETGQFNKLKPGEIAKKLAKEHDITVKEDEKSDKTITRFVVRDGERAERAIRRVLREHGLFLTDDEEGNLVIPKAGSKGSGDPLVLGSNIYEYTSTEDVSERHNEYKSKGTQVSTDDNYGYTAVAVGAKAEDEYIPKTRKFRVHAKGDIDTDSAKKRVAVEARRRAAEGTEVSVTVTSFSQSSGKLWLPNTLHQVTLPPESLDFQLLLKSVEYKINNTSTHEVTLTLVPPDAYKSGDKDSKSKETKGSKNNENFTSVDKISIRGDVSGVTTA
jgi:prophage tail gpP-like protein